IAENRLGMSALDLHGAHHMAGFMPEGMQQYGTDMHRAASRFMQVVQDAEVEGNPEKVFGALRAITSACAGCHVNYRVQ
ncbi:MAG: cytochrome c, partial [Magnetococcales bacterium]|nr:cytochrome c [Magnetococcales bacterium]